MKFIDTIITNISTFGLAVLDSPPVFFSLSMIAISLSLIGISAVGLLFYYRRVGSEDDVDPEQKRRRALQVTGIAGLSGAFGAAGGGASMLHLEGRDFTDVLSSVTDLWSEESRRPPAVEGVPGLLLTWQRDPTTTMTIDWHTEDGAPSEPVVRVRRADQSSWQEVGAETKPFPATTDHDSVDERLIHRVELTDLEPGTEYEFQFAGYDREYSFRTMPAEISPDRPLRFAAGGDTSPRWDHSKPINDVVVEQDLDFIQWGGDLAYANGIVDNVTDWFDWFAVNKHTLITDAGRVIPILVTIGDAETLDDSRTDDFVNYSQDQKSREFISPYFYELFAFPGEPGYGILDFGDYLSFAILDSNCTNPVVGKQTDWLEDELAARTDRPYLFTSYHQSAFPVFREWDSGQKEAIRSHWAPLFEEYDITIALENGEHAYKRSKPIKDGSVSEDGIRYAGGGCWSRPPRPGKNSDAWYMDHFERDRHAVIVELDGETADFEVLNEQEQIIDEFSMDTRV